MLFKLILLLLSSLLYFHTALAQLESDLSSANECRHVAILSRNGNETYTSSCFIPTVTVPFSKFRLGNSIPDDYQWVLNHTGTVSGQIVFYRRNSMAIISQKECLDSGRAVGRLGRFVYNNVSSARGIESFAADFLKEGGRGDAYMDCAFSNTSWNQYQVKGNGTTRTRPMPSNVVQLVRKHTGGHIGSGDFLIPFDFSYEQKQIESEFRRGLQLVLNALNTGEEPTQNEFDRFKTKQPILRRTYPFESGLSLLALNNTNLNLGTQVKNIDRNLSVAAWNRLLESVTSLSSQYNPPVQLPEQIRREVLFSLIAVTILSIMACRAVLAKLSVSKAEVVRKWPTKADSSPWVLIKSHSDFQKKAKYHYRTNRDSLEAVAAFGSALIAIIAAILEFANSDLRPQLFVTIQQGGAVTYGYQNNDQSDDVTNSLAGTPFAIGHWVVVQINYIGNVAGYTAIICFYTILLLFLVRILFKFSCERERLLGSVWINRLFRVVRVPIQLLTTMLSYMPVPTKYSPFTRYTKAYRSLVNRLCQYHHFPEFDPNRGTCGIDRQIKLPLRKTESEAGHTGLSEDDIEKAAVIIASDSYGRLKYVQALALITDTELTYAVDRYKSHDQLPSEMEVRRLASLYYLYGALLPGANHRGFPERNISLEGIEDKWDGPDQQEFKVWSGSETNKTRGRQRRVGLVLGADERFTKRLNESGVAYSYLTI